ncbi:uncharacterized protein [Hyperolius riggenbachi]|uniref:uncharacterized protein n=1 Tax=Hyperolius riggenbachi TaxID=752182 RepID=UPI0035A2CF82
MQDCSLTDLTLKVSFLTAISSARRVSELQALGCDPPYIHFFPDRVTLKPIEQFIPKVATQFHFSQEWNLPSFSDNILESPDSLNIPELIRIYIERSMFQAQNNASSYDVTKENFPGRVQRGKLSKSDIGSPSNFKHITHVGFDGTPRPDRGSDTHLNRLLNTAGVSEPHLMEKGFSPKFPSTAEKERIMEAVQKMARRKTTVEKPSARSRLRSLSSSSLIPSKRLNGPVEPSPQMVKASATIPEVSPFNRLPPLRKLPPPPHHTPPHFLHLPSRPPPPVPPYLGELAQNFTPGNNSALRTRMSKNVPAFASPPKSIPRRNTKGVLKLATPAEEDCFLTPPSVLNIPPGSGSFPFPWLIEDSPYLSSLPSNETSGLKYGGVPKVPPNTPCVESFNADETLTPYLLDTPNPEPEYGTLLLNEEPEYGTVNLNAELDYGTVLLNEEPEYGTVNLNAEPDYGTVPLNAEPEYGTVNLNAEPDYGTVPLNAEPEYETIPLNAEPKYGALSLSIEPEYRALPVNLEPNYWTVPPAPPLPFRLQSSSGKLDPLSSNKHLLSTSSQPPLDIRFRTIFSSDRQDVMVPSKACNPQNESTRLLDQIRQGVQLKSIGQTVKVGSPECCHIVRALRDVIQKRHKAIHASDHMSYHVIRTWRKRLVLQRCLEVEE